MTGALCDSVLLRRQLFEILSCEPLGCFPDAFDFGSAVTHLPGSTKSTKRNQSNSYTVSTDEDDIHVKQLVTYIDQMSQDTFWKSPKAFS